MASDARRDGGPDQGRRSSFGPPGTDDGTRAPGEASDQDTRAWRFATDGQEDLPDENAGEAGHVDERTGRWDAAAAWEGEDQTGPWAAATGLEPAYDTRAWDEAPVPPGAWYDPGQGNAPGPPEGYDQAYADGYGQAYPAGYGDQYSQGYEQPYAEGYSQYPGTYEPAGAGGQGPEYLEGYGQAYPGTYDGPYTEGYDPAYAEGYDPAYAEGYDETYTEGYDPAYAEGYDPAQAESYDPAYAEVYGGYTAQEAGYAAGYEAAAPDQAWDGPEEAVAGRRRRRSGPWPELVAVTAVAIVVAALILALTTAKHPNLSATQSSLPNLAGPAAGAPGGGTSRQLAPGSSAVPRPSTTQPVTSTTGRTTTSPPTTAQPAQALVVTPGVAQSLVRSWLASDPGNVGLSPQDVAGTVAGQAYYGDQPASRTYWAVAAFRPSPTVTAESSTAVGQEKLALFQDSTYVFSWRSGPVWTLLGEVPTGSCPSWVPSPVLRAWGLCGL